MMRSSVLSAVVGAFLICAARSGDTMDAPGAGNAERVHAFVHAFNAHDPEAMGALVTDDVQWLAIDGAKLSVETDGKAALLTSMRSYFESCATCRSQLQMVTPSASRVSALEVASWESATGRKQQRGFSLCEFKDSLISRVYYFPAEP